MNDPRERLILLARIREELYRLREQGKLSEGALRVRLAQLDNLASAPLAELEPVPLGDLLQASRDAGLHFDDSPLRTQLRGDTLESLRSRREEALADDEDVLDLSDQEKGLKIPLRPFDPATLRRRFSNVLEVLRRPETTREEATSACRSLRSKATATFISPITTSLEMFYAKIKRCNGRTYREIY